MAAARDPFESLFAAIAKTVDPSSDDGAFVRSLFVASSAHEGRVLSGVVTTHGGFGVCGRRHRRPDSTPDNPAVTRRVN